MNVAITGIGVVSPIGIGSSAFCQGLREGNTNFSRVEIMHQEKTFVFCMTDRASFAFRIAFHKAGNLPPNWNVMNL